MVPKNPGAQEYRRIIDRHNRPTTKHLGLKNVDRVVWAATPVKPPSTLSKINFLSGLS